MRRVRRLPRNVSETLRSQTILVGLDQVAEELVCNALDAGARDILILADLSCRQLEVHDDGDGMSFEDLKECGKRHHTSKIDSMEDLESGPNTLGFRGEALASLADSCTLEICTREKSSFETYKKILCGGRLLQLGLETINRDMPGTSVHVLDFQFNQPVRKKFMNTRATMIELEALRHKILCLALSHPDCKFHAREKRTGNLLSCGAGTDPFQLYFSTITSGLESHFKRSRRKRGSWDLDGTISVPPHGTKSKKEQCLFVNGRFIRSGMVHELLEKAFHSLNAMVSSKSNDLPLNGRCKEGISPSFLLFIKCPSRSHSILSEQDKSAIDFHDIRQIKLAVRYWLEDAWSDVLPWQHGECSSSWQSTFLEWQRWGEARIDQSLFLSKKQSHLYPEAEVKACHRKRCIGCCHVEKAKRHQINHKKSTYHVSLTSDPLGEHQDMMLKWRKVKGSLANATNEHCNHTRSGQHSQRVRTSTLLAENKIMDVIQLCNYGLYNRLLPLAISREGLQDAMVYGQVDKKFIVAKVQGTLIVVDQHAADERVRLENLQQQVQQSFEEANPNLSQRVEPVIEMEVTKEEMMFLSLYKVRVERWGWKFNGEDCQQEPAKGTRTKVYITSVPCICGVELCKDSLIEYLHELASTCGAPSMPPRINSILKSKACRGAIMFGDELSRTQSRCLLRNLAIAKLSLQCAHGRPTIAPLVNLYAFKEIIHARRSMSDASPTAKRLTLANLRPSTDTCQEC